MKLREHAADLLRHLAVWLEGGTPELPPLGMNTLDGELNLLVLQGSWLPEDTPAELFPHVASTVIRGSDCETLYRVTLTKADPA